MLPGDSLSIICSVPGPTEVRDVELRNSGDGVFLTQACVRATTLMSSYEIGHDDHRGRVEGGDRGENHGRVGVILISPVIPLDQFVKRPCKYRATR